MHAQQKHITSPLLVLFSLWWTAPTLFSSVPPTSIVLYVVLETDLYHSHGHKCLGVLPSNWFCHYNTISLWDKYCIQFLLTVIVASLVNIKFKVGWADIFELDIKIYFYPRCFLFCFYNTLLCSLTLSASFSPPLWDWPPSVFQATAPVSIPVCPELAGLGSDNGISVSWQSPPVIFKGTSVSDAVHCRFFCWFHNNLPSQDMLVNPNFILWSRGLGLSAFLW